MCSSDLCDDTTCPYPGQVCSLAADGVSPECVCRCFGDMCRVEGNVCGDNGRTFQSYAHFMRWRCESQQYDTEIAYFGICQS